MGGRQRVMPGTGGGVRRYYIVLPMAGPQTAPTAELGPAAGGRLAGKVALITGAGSGIGQAAASRFVEEGALVAVADVRGDAAEETVEQIGAGLPVRLDVTDQSSIESGLRSIVERFNGLDVLVNNAGIEIFNAAHETPEADWDRQFDTNLKGIYRVSKAAWPLLAAAKGGAIVSTASTIGIWAHPEDAAYCTSKAGVIMLTKCMALDGAKAGIRANCVCPGFTLTAMVKSFFEGQPDPQAAEQQATNLHPLGRLAEPRDIANAMLFLASDDASWITGESLVVDGGLTVGLWGLSGG